MQYLNKNKYTGENCYDDSIDAYKEKFSLGHDEVLDCLANSKPTIQAEDFSDAEPEIHVPYECSFQRHIGYRDMHKNFEMNLCSVGWKK